jgi:hypothetical protein
LVPEFLGARKMSSKLKQKDGLIEDMKKKKKSTTQSEDPQIIQLVQSVQMLSLEIEESEKIGFALQEEIFRE